MKSLIVRLSVLALATTGFAASTVSSKAVDPKHEVKPVVIAGTPVGMCMPRDPTHCGLD